MDNTTNMQKENVNVEIDLFQLAFKLWQRKFLIVLISSVFATLALVGSIFIVTPKYSSTTRLYVVNNRRDQESSITAGDLQAGTFLTKDYQEIIKSREVMASVTEQFGNSQEVTNLVSNVSVSIPSDTRIIAITVRNENPELAAQLANAVRIEAIDMIKEVTKVEEVTTLEEAVPSLSPSSPNIKRNVAIGLLLGAVVSMTGVMLAEVLNDTVMRADDIEEVMGLTLLGIVPNSEKL